MRHYIVLFLTLAQCAPLFQSQAASSSWTNPAGGSWTNAANWAGGVIAEGAGNLASFTGLSLSAPVVVSLDGPHTIGNLAFDDQNLSPHDWTLVAGNAGSFTLAGTNPTITVLSATTTLKLPVSGNAGLLKNGAGKLALASTNAYSGVTAVQAGLLQLPETTLSASNSLNLTAAAAVAEAAGPLSLVVNATAPTVAVSGPGILRLVMSTNNPAVPDLYFGPNHSANNYWGARVAAPLDLGTRQRYIFGKTGHNGVGPYGLTGTDCQFGGSISGLGGLTIIAQNNWTGTNPMETAFALNASNSFTGPLTIQRGSVYLGNANALNQTNTLTFNAAASNNARLFLYGNNAVVADLSSSGAGTALIANGNLKSGATVTLGAVTLTVQQNQNTEFGGTLTDTYAEYTGSGSGTTGPLNLLKTGTGTLRLSGASTYSGTTTISSGTLLVDGSLAASPVNIQSGGTLAGNGLLTGPVTVQNGSWLSPGSNGVGTLTLQNTLSLAGTTRIELAKAGMALSGDQVVGLTSLTYGGTLSVTNVGAWPLESGDSFNLFTAASYSGAFATMDLPPLASGLAWDTANLPVNGSVTVVAAQGPPLLLRPPQSLTVAEGASAQFNVMAAGPRPLLYQWQRAGSPIAGATASSFNLPQAGTNDAAAYRVVVTNAYGSITSAVATLTIIPANQTSGITNGLAVYLNFDNTLSAQSPTTNSGTLYLGGATLGPRYHPGQIGAAASFTNTPTAGQPNDWAISLGNLEWIYAGDFTLSLWEKTSGSSDGALIGNKNWSSGANVGWVLSALDGENLNYNAVNGTRRDIDLNPPLSDGNWHLVTLSFNRAANQVISYVDSQALQTSDISPGGSASFNAGLNTLVGSSGNGPYAARADIDDLGIWTRVLTPQEISGIYAAGLNHLPLTAAVPGAPPVITNAPASVSVATGGRAVFSVSVTGPGPFTYQWRCNGTNLVGATNATLVLPAVGPADQGVYTVLISNGTGAVLSSGAVLSVYALAVTGQWDFEFGDLRATVGSDLEYVADTANQTSFPVVPLNGQPARVMALGSNSVLQGFLMRHGGRPNGGGHFVNQYTLLMDVLFPTASNGQWRALLQTDPFNHPGNAAEFAVGNDTTTPTPNGIGAENQYDGPLAPETWYRLAFVVDLTAPAGQQLTKYLNGVVVGSQSLSGGIDGRYALGPTALLFASGQPGGTSAGLVNSIQFVNGCLSAAAVAALGGPSAAGLPPGDGALKIQSLGRNASTLDLTWSGPAYPGQLQKTTNPAAGAWKDLTNLSTAAHTLSVPITEPSAFYRLKEAVPDLAVGLLPDSRQSLPSKQLLHAAGRQIQFAGRPVDLALAPGGARAYLKNLNSLLVVDVPTWRVLQNLTFPGNGASMHGIALSPDGTRVYATGSGNELYEWTVATNGIVTFSRTIALPGGSDPCGVTLSADGTQAYVCLSIKNTLAVVDLASGTLTRQLPVGVAPFDVVLSPDGHTAYVSDWGGRRATNGEATATSAGTPVVIDSRGVAASGAVSFVDLVAGAETAQVPTGLHPSALALSPDGQRLYVANANSDSVSVIDISCQCVRETILVRPDPSFPYGSATDGLALSPDGRNLFVAAAGNNAVAWFELPNSLHTNSVLQGFMPTDWYPGAVAADSNAVYVVNVKGLGSRQGQPVATSFQIAAFLGTANQIALPDAEALSKYTAEVFENSRVPQIRQTQQLLRSGQRPVPVPARVGEPSLFQHVLYILKENKTYDQIFGDLPQGNGQASLCVYPRLVTPNHHALAEQWALVDNYYCNGVNSADGHSWSTEANCTDHLEKSFGGFSRSYTFGDDPLTYSASGFLWNNALQHGLSFRNYGEMDYASPSPSATWLQIYQDFTNHTGVIGYVQNIGVASLRPYSSTNVPGWNLNIPDVVRADRFIRELNAAQTNGTWAALHLLYLPNDHTGGPPSPRAQVADNDLALGRVVEAVTKSVFWTNTVIFVIEDDPQSGYDHVDAHRSICLVISPYTKRGQVLSTFYNQAGVLHTMEQILGLPPMNQQDAMAPLLTDCFTDVPDFTPYTALANNVALAEGVSTASLPPARQRYWARQLEQMDFSHPDRINEDLFNRYVWETIKGTAPYPARFAGAHGRGLRALGLRLERSLTVDDD